MDTALIQKKIYVVYHDDLDGYAAAWAAWTQFGDSAEYKATNYGRPFPFDELMHGMHPAAELYILDFCPPRSELIDLAMRVGHVEVIDHHASSAKACGDLPCTYFNTFHSGVALAWIRFYGLKKALAVASTGDIVNELCRLPWSIRHIQDYDLWQFNYSETKAAVAWFNLFQDEPLWVFDKEMSAFNRSSVAIIESGRAILTHIEFEVSRTARNANNRMILLSGRKGLCINATAYMNELSHELLKLHPEAAFVATWRGRSNGGIRISLRSRSAEECNVAELASEFGGGGHPCAAGMELDLDQFFALPVADGMES